MTVLSRLELRARHLAVIRDLADSAEMHRTLMRAFEQSDDPSPRAAHGVLFRIEDRQVHKTVLVQSQARPDWDRLPAAYLLDAQTKEIDNALAAISIGRRLRFLLVANPSRKVAREDGSASRHSRRVELTTDDRRYEWLVARGARHGFALEDTGPHAGVRIDRELAPQAARRGGITVKAVRYEGHLVVTDADRFASAITQGIGPAKAYGCGLLSVAPA